MAVEVPADIPVPFTIEEAQVSNFHLYFLNVDTIYELTEIQTCHFLRSTWNNRIHPLIHGVPSHWTIQLANYLN